MGHTLVVVILAPFYNTSVTYNYTIAAVRKKNKERRKKAKLERIFIGARAQRVSPVSDVFIYNVQRRKKKGKLVSLLAVWVRGANYPRI